MKGLEGNMKFLFFYVMILMGYLFFISHGLGEGLITEYDIQIPEQPTPSESWFDNIWNGISNFIDTVGFYWTVFTITPEIEFMTGLFIVFGVIIILIFIKDYLTPITQAIGNLIPFT